MKKKAKSGISKKEITPALPQNIVPVGERVFDDKNIYIHQRVYAQIHKFAENKTENEHGGILVGRVLNEMGKENTIIEGFIEARYNAATPTTLTFTHETWDYFHAEIDKKYKGKKIVGWIHTHPNFGIFLSENDRFIQQNFFVDVNQVAYVVDPIQNDEGFFFWVNEKLERCPGFYLFDKNGVKIKQKAWSVNQDESENDEGQNKNGKRSIFTVVIVLIMIANLFITLYQSQKINVLKKQIDDLNLALQYGVFSLYGSPPVSDIADNIRQQFEIQKQFEEQEAHNSEPENEHQEPETNEQEENNENKA